jgi:hypothetical protein
MLGGWVRRPPKSRHVVDLPVHEVAGDRGAAETISNRHLAGGGAAADDRRARRSGHLSRLRKLAQAARAVMTIEG